MKQLIGYNPDVYSYFKEQEHLCAFDLNLTYPQNGYFPSLNLQPPTDRNVTASLSKTRVNRQSFIKEAATRSSKRSNGQGPPMRDLTGRANGTVDGWYGCYLYYEMLDYALNHSFPWSMCTHLTSPPSDAHYIYRSRFGAQQWYCF